MERQKVRESRLGAISDGLVLRLKGRLPHVRVFKDLDVAHNSLPEQDCQGSDDNDDGEQADRRPAVARVGG